MKVLHLTKHDDGDGLRRHHSRHTEGHDLLRTIALTPQSIAEKAQGATHRCRHDERPCHQVNSQPIQSESATIEDATRDAYKSSWNPYLIVSVDGRDLLLVNDRVSTIKLVRSR